MADLLTELISGAVADAAGRRARVPLERIEEEAAKAAPPINALEVLKPTGSIKVIAEVKRASPSRGDLASITSPADLASSYEQGGASAISVLTEGRRFKGSLDDLVAVKRRVNVPVLRKDFIADPYQVLEARAAGADMVLLIVAALDQDTLAELYQLTIDLEMTPLVEAHTGEEVQRALDLGASLIGINARDLTTFTMDRDLFARLAPSLPEDVISVAESAVSTRSDVEHYRSSGADVVLIGEALVTNDPVATLDDFLKAGS